MGGRNNGLGGISGNWGGPNRTPGQVGGGISGGWPTGGGDGGYPTGGINPPPPGQIRGVGGTNYGFSTPAPAPNLGQALAQPPMVNKEEPMPGPPQPAVTSPGIIPPAVNQAEAKPAGPQERLQPAFPTGYQQWGAKPINRGLGLNQPQATTSQDGSAQGPSGGGTSGGPGQWAGNQSGFDAFKAGRSNDKPGPAGYGGGNGTAPNGYAWEGAQAAQPNAVWNNARTGQNYNGVNQPGGTVNQMPPQRNEAQPSQPGKGQGEVGGYNQQAVQGNRMGIRRQTPGQWW